MNIILKDQSDTNLPKIWKTHKLSKLDIHNLSDLYTFIPEPLPDELFTSWLVRIADMNYFSFVEFLRNFADMDYNIMKTANQKKYWIYDLDKEIPDEILNFLSKKTDFFIEKINNMTLKPWTNTLYELFITNHKTIKNGGLRYCPFCLDDDEIPYYRKEWRLKFVTCCSKHKIYLYDRCFNPKCRNALKISLMKHKMILKQCVYCGCDLSKSPIKKVPENDKYMKYMEKILSSLKLGNGDFLGKKINELYPFLEALYFLSRFIIAYFPFNTSKYQDHELVSSRTIKNVKKKLEKMGNVFENIQISHLVLSIGCNLLTNHDELDKFISKNQTQFNYWTQKGRIPTLLEDFRKSKGNNPTITKKRLEDAINNLKKKNIHLNYNNIAKEAKCAENFYLSHPKLKDFVDSIKEKDNYQPKRRKRKSYKVIIKEEDVNRAILFLKENNQKITYTTIADIIKENPWNLKSRPEIVKIIKPHLSNQGPKKKYYFNENDIYEALRQIRELGLKISINEVCRQLNCHKTFFRNHPELKKIILQEREKELEKYDMLVPKYNIQKGLSTEALKFEPIYIQYQKEMDRLGKDWRITKNKTLSLKLGIPLEILIEIKIKYCPSARNEVRRQKEKEIQKVLENSKKEFQLSKEAKKYESIYAEYVKMMIEEGKSYKSARTNLLSKKLSIPLKILLEIKKKYYINNI